MGNCGATQEGEIVEKFNTTEPVEKKNAVRDIADLKDYNNRTKQYAILVMKALGHRTRKQGGQGNVSKPALMFIFNKMLAEYHSIVLTPMNEKEEFDNYLKTCKDIKFGQTQNNLPFLERLTIKYTKDWFDCNEISGAYFVSQYVKPVINHDLVYLNLNLKNFELGDTGVSFLIEFISYRLKSLEELRINLAGCGIKIQGLAKLIQEINKLTSLKKLKLNLPKNDIVITKETQFSMCELTRLKYLKHFSLNLNQQITPTEHKMMLPKQIFRIAKKLPVLRELVCKFNSTDKSRKDDKEYEQDPELLEVFQPLQKKLDKLEIL